MIVELENTYLLVPLTVSVALRPPAIDEIMGLDKLASAISEAMMAAEKVGAALTGKRRDLEAVTMILKSKVTAMRNAQQS